MRSWAKGKRFPTARRLSPCGVRAPGAKLGYAGGAVICLDCSTASAAFLGQISALLLRLSCILTGGVPAPERLSCTGAHFAGVHGPFSGSVS